MQTNFSLTQLADPDIAEVNRILRACVHCGFCTATCPTYVLLGDELDSPRGRIYLIKDMLERDIPAPARTVQHVDRCLSCLSCMTTCPSGVHYMHLVDQARAHIDRTAARPIAERLLRDLLAIVLPRPFLFRLALLGAALARPLALLMPGRLAAMLNLSPKSVPPPDPVDRPQIIPAEGVRRGRVALMSGCAQQVLAPDINAATARLLTRMGSEVVVARGTGCCGALVHHLGRAEESRHQAARNIRAWTREIEGDGLDAVIVNASGCGTTVKDYGFMFREDAALAEPAARVAELTRDVSEYLAEIGLPPPSRETGQRVAYHAACSLQHGQRITEAPKTLLAAAGFNVLDVPEGHLCCGSAGTYNILQPDLADQLKRRKIDAIQSTEPELVAVGNIGCLTQIAGDAGVPVVHTVELLDWANGGPKPAALVNTTLDPPR